MAAASEKNEDLSMEEILQSIRKIISDDDETETPKETDEADMAADTTKEDIEATGSDVLELTELMEEVEEVEEAPAQEPLEAMDVLAEIDDALDIAEEPAAEPEPAAVEPEPAPAEEPVEKVPAAPAPTAEAMDVDKLLSDDAATASAASLMKVVATHKSANPSPGFRSGTSVEELVLESLKPMLKEWLDANLPSMVERIVEREIRKLVD